MTKAAELYERDFFAWTQEQAKVLGTHFRGDSRLDVEHLAEEIEDLRALLAEQEAAPIAPERRLRRGP